MDSLTQLKEKIAARLAQLEASLAADPRNGIAADLEGLTALIDQCADVEKQLGAGQLRLELLNEKIQGREHAAESLMEKIAFLEKTLVEKKIAQHGFKAVNRKTANDFLMVDGKRTIAGGRQNSCADGFECIDSSGRAIWLDRDSFIGQYGEPLVDNAPATRGPATAKQQQSFLSVEPLESSAWLAEKSTNVIDGRRDFPRISGYRCVTHDLRENWLSCTEFEKLYGPLASVSKAA